MTVLPYLIIVPLFSALMILLFGKRFRYFSEITSSVSALSVLFMVLSVLKNVSRDKIDIFNVGHWASPYGITLFTDSLSALILAVSSVVILLVVIYSISYAKIYFDNWKYYALLMIATAGINGVLITGDIFNLFVFMEVSSVAIYALVAFSLESEALEGAFKYAVMSAVGSAFIFLGIAFLYSYTGTLNMADMANIVSSIGKGNVIPFVSVLFLMGFGLKSAIVPFHGWMSDAYAKAPATIPAVSSGVLIKVLGLYVLTRIFFNVFGMDARISRIFIILAVLSMVLGAILAFSQTNIRRLLAYSSISQIGYIVLGLGVGTPLAIFGAFFHLINHSVAKSLVFLGSGVCEGYTSTDEVKSMSGIVAKDRVAGYSILSGIMSISGIPPFAGFWSKIIIIFACIKAGHPFLAFAAVAVGLVTIAYYFKAFTPVLFAPAISDEAVSYKASFQMKFALLFLAVLTIALSLVLLPGDLNTMINNTVYTVKSGSAALLSMMPGVSI